MPQKKHKPEEIVAKLRQVDMLMSQGQQVAFADRDRDFDDADDSNDLHLAIAGMISSPAGWAMTLSKKARARTR